MSVLCSPSLTKIISIVDCCFLILQAQIFFSLSVVGWTQNCMTNDRQLQKPRTSAANAVQDARAAEVTPHAAVAGVQGGNTTGALALRRSRRRRGGNLTTTACSTAPAAFHVARGRNSIDFGPRDLLRGRSLCSKESSTSTCSLSFWTTRDRPWILHLLNCQVPHELLLQRQQGIDHRSCIYSMVQYLMSYCCKGNGT